MRASTIPICFFQSGGQNELVAKAEQIAVTFSGEFLPIAGDMNSGGINSFDGIKCVMNEDASICMHGIVLPVNGIPAQKTPSEVQIGRRWILVVVGGKQFFIVRCGFPFRTPFPFQFC